MRSSHRLPMTVAALWGSAEKAFRPSMLILRAWSFAFVLSCLAFREFVVIEDFLGLAGLLVLCTGGSVEDRPGGERASMDGKSSRGLGDWNGGMRS